jgi:hypothetical protein
MGIVFGCRDHVDDDIRPEVLEDFAEPSEVAALAEGCCATVDAADAGGESRLSLAPMEDGNAMAALMEALHNVRPDEPRAAQNKNSERN